MRDASIDPRIAAVLHWCASEGYGEVILAVPFTLSTDQVRALLARRGVSGIVLSSPPGALADAPLPGGRLGEFRPAEYSWRLPTCAASRIVYVSGLEKLSARMIGAALLGGVRDIVYWDLDRWRSRSLLILAAHRVQQRLSSDIQVGLGKIGAPGLAVAALVESISGYRLRGLLDQTSGFLPPAQAPVAGRIVIACPTLVAGGAERQIVNTVIELCRRDDLDVAVLVSNLFAPPGNDFFLDCLVEAGARVEEVQGSLSRPDRWIGDAPPADARLTKQLRLLLKRLPAETAQEVANLYLAFRERRPAVVHAWLDHSAICAGLAALMAGVPRVLLGGRNVSPLHFAYILKPIMRPAYRAMATRPETLFLNNSHGGAADYAAWLGLDVSRFRILYNGLDNATDTGGVTRAAAEGIAEFRQRYGIPVRAQLVGGMFRLSAEKRPALWVDALARLVAAREDAYGLLFGAGPLQVELEAKLERAGLADRIRLAPPTKESVLALSAFDVLLLTSRWEGTPNVVIEAQAVGTPVVVSGGGGARESLLQGVTGLFVEQPSADALAAALRSLLDDPAQRQRLADAGPSFVAERFSLDRMIAETLQIYGL